jgi:hypothetical protein
LDIYAFFLSIGGSDALSGTDFSLYCGRELSAYIRWFNKKNPSESVKILIKNAMLVNGKDPIAAFDSIKELCRIEGLSRNIDVIGNRGWTIKEDKISNK